MLHPELRLIEIQERQRLLRSRRYVERLPSQAARSLRSRLGESLIRLGRRVAGEDHPAPAWTG